MNKLLTATIYLIEGSVLNSVVIDIDGYTYTSLTNISGTYYGIPITVAKDRTIPDIINTLRLAFSDGLTYEQVAELYKIGLYYPEGKKYLVTQCHIY